MDLSCSSVRPSVCTHFYLENGLSYLGFLKKLRYKYDSARYSGSQDIRDFVIEVGRNVEHFAC